MSGSLNTLIFLCLRTFTAHAIEFIPALGIRRIWHSGASRRAVHEFVPHQGDYSTDLHGVERVSSWVHPCIQEGIWTPPPRLPRSFVGIARSVQSAERRKRRDRGPHTHTTELHYGAKLGVRGAEHRPLDVAADGQSPPARLTREAAQGARASSLPERQRLNNLPHI